MKKHIPLICIGLLLHSYFLIGQDKYFYKQYAWDINQNGRDLLVLNDSTIIICGNGVLASTDKWDSFILELDEYGEQKNLSNHLEEIIRTNYRKIFSSNGSLITFGDTYFSGDYPTNLNSAIRMTQINDSLEIDSQMWVLPNKNKDIQEAIQVKGNYVLGGHYIDSSDPDSYWQPYIAMVDSIGTIIWEIEMENYDLNNLITGIAWDQSSGVIYIIGIIGFTEIGKNLLFLKLSENGEIILEKEISSLQDESSISMIKKGEHLMICNNYYIEGTDSRGQLLKLTEIGNSIWATETFPGERNSFNDLIEGASGHIYGTGAVLKESNWQAFLVKYDADGNILWKRLYGGEDADYAYAITDIDGSILITGRTESNTDGADVLLIKTNCMGLFTEPQAQFTHQINNNQVIFENLSQYVYPDSIDGGHYIWDFGDGNISNELNPIHIYEEANPYEVTLTAIVCQDTSIYKECLYLDENTLCCAEVEDLPIAAFSIQTEADSLSINFVNESLFLYEDYNNGASVFWDFGDGQTSSEMNPIHTYSEANLYEVKLTLVFCQDTFSLLQNIMVGDTTDTALNHLSLAEKVLVYPNPSSGLFNFEFSPLPKASNLLIFNSIGEAIQTVKIEPSQALQTLDLNDFSKGIYFWQWGGENGKLVLE